MLVPELVEDRLVEIFAREKAPHVYCLESGPAFVVRHLVPPSKRVVDKPNKTLLAVARGVSVG